MDIFIKFVIIIFFLSFWYIAYFWFQKIHRAYFKVKKAIHKEDISATKTALNKVDLNTKEKNYKQNPENKKLTAEEKEHISELLKRVRINSTKWYFDTAKALIVEWLSIDKFNKDLNLELALIYEKEKKYENAEYIYKDLLETQWDDMEILKKMAYNYALENKLELAMETYEKIHKKDITDDKVIDMLAEISYSIWDYEKSLKYINLFLKDNPRDINKLTMKAFCLENDWHFKDAYSVHRRIVELQPYNTISNQKLKDLEEYMQ